MSSNKYNSNKQGIDVIDIINEYDNSGFKVFNLEKTMMKSGLDAWTTQITFILNDKNAIEMFDSSEDKRQVLGQIIYDAFNHILKTDNREILFMSIELNPKGMEIKDSIIRTESSFEFHLGKAFNYISTSTFKQVPMHIWKELDNKGVLAKAQIQDHNPYSK